MVSPPIYSRFFRGKTAYAMGKVGMSVMTIGMAMDFQREQRTEMAITSLWPAAVSLPGTDARRGNNDDSLTTLSGRRLGGYSKPTDRSRAVEEADDLLGRRARHPAIADGRRQRRVLPGRGLPPRAQRRH